MTNKQAFWLWLLQRISAALIFFILAAHLWHVHYLELGKPILYAGVAARLKGLLTLSIDSAILLLGLFHGLNGVRMVLLDYEYFDQYERPLSWVLLFGGALFFILGVKGLWAFIIR